MFFTTASTFQKKTKSEFCNGACAFISKILLADKLQKCYDRTQERIKILKVNNEKEREVPELSKSKKKLFSLIETHPSFNRDTLEKVLNEYEEPKGKL